MAFAGKFFDDFSFLGRFSNYWDLNAASYFEWGLSGIVGKTAEGGDSQVYGTDFSYLWRPAIAGEIPGNYLEDRVSLVAQGRRDR